MENLDVIPWFVDRKMMFSPWDMFHVRFLWDPSEWVISKYLNLQKTGLGCTRLLGPEVLARMQSQVTPQSATGVCPSPFLKGYPIQSSQQNVSV